MPGRAREGGRAPARGRVSVLSVLLGVGAATVLALVALFRSQSSTPVQQLVSAASGSPESNTGQDVPQEEPQVLKAAQDEESASGTEPPSGGKPVSASGLPVREDHECNSLADSNAEKVFECRKRVAQDAAKRKCGELESQPPEPPFLRANLVLTGARRGQRLPIAVEPHGDIVSNALIASGMFEYHEVSTAMAALDAVASRAGRNATLLDVGANLGLYSLAAAALGHSVLAFEAMPRNVAAMQTTLCWNPELAGRVTLFPYGLGDEEAACRVTSHDTNRADGHVVCTQDQLAAYPEYEARGVAHVVRLGDYVPAAAAAAAGHVDVVKLDVEGFEPKVLAGAGDAFKHVQFALSELNANDLASKNGASAADVAKEYLAAWERLGFDLRLCSEHRSCFEDALAAPADVVDAVVAHSPRNVLFERRGRGSSRSTALALRL